MTIYMVNIFLIVLSCCLTNNAYFVKRNVIVKHMARKVYTITKNIVASTNCAFEGWSMFKVMKPSMSYLDDNHWEAGQQHFVN